MTQPTVSAQLTPPGRGAVAVVRVNGPEAEAAVAKCFTAANGKEPGEWPVGRIAFGRWGGTNGEEVIAARRAGQQLEVHCHGGAAAVGRVLSDLAESGCTVLDSREPADQSQLAAEARKALPEALTLRAAGVLLDQLHGALEDAVSRASALIHEGNLRVAAELLRETHCRFPLGSKLTAPWRVVLAGRPNAGKSSLLNAIVGYRRAIVHAEPGTTRDAIGEVTAIDGWPVRLSDTAGLRSGAGPVEQEGIRRARASVVDADLVLWVRDLTEPGTRAETPPAGPSRSLSVWNKCDLKSLPDASGPGELAVSALTGEGLPELLAAISERLIPAPPPAGAAVPFLPWHAELLAAAGAACEDGNTDEAASLLSKLSGLAGPS